MSTRRVVAINTASQLIGKFLSAGTAFLVSFLVARNFGAEGFGEFTKITTYVAFFFFIADFGLNAIFLQQKTPFSILLGLRAAGGLLLIFLSLAILAFIPHGQDQGYTGFVRLGIILFSPAIFFQGLITTTNAIFQKQLRYDLATMAITAGAAGTIVALWIFQWSGILGSIFALITGSIVTAIAALFLSRQFVDSLSIRIRIPDMIKLFLPAVPLGLTLLFNLVYFHADSVILTITRSTTEVGIYGLAFKVFEVPLVIPTFFMNAVYPLMLKTKSENFVALFKKSFIALFITSLVSLIAMWFASPLLLFIRADFAASIGVLRVLSLGMPFFFMSSLVMWALIALKKQYLLAIIYGCSMLLNILLNIWLIPLYGYMAAAWITVVSEAVVLLFSGFVLRKAL